MVDLIEFFVFSMPTKYKAQFFYFNVGKALVWYYKRL